MIDEKTIADLRQILQAGSPIGRETYQAIIEPHVQDFFDTLEVLWKVARTGSVFLGVLQSENIYGRIYSLKEITGG